MQLYIRELPLLICLLSRYFHLNRVFNIIRIFKKIAGGNLNGYFFLLALTNYVFIYFALNNWGKWHTPDNKKLNSVLFLVLYSSFFGMFYNAIVVRAGLALSILLLATSLLSKSQLNYKDLFFAGCFLLLHCLSIILLF